MDHGVATKLMFCRQRFWIQRTHKSRDLERQIAQEENAISILPAISQAVPRGLTLVEQSSS